MSDNVIILSTILFRKIYKNNFFSKLDNKTFYLNCQDNQLNFIFCSDDIDIKYDIVNSCIVKYFDNYIGLIDNDLDVKCLNNISFLIEEVAIMFLLKISLNTEKIIIIFHDEKVEYIYKDKGTIFTIKANHIYKSVKFTSKQYSSEQIYSLKTQVNDFSTIISSHNIVQDYKGLTGEGPQIQLLIDDQLRILSTNYIVGLISNLEVLEFNLHEKLQLQIKKNIEINKLCNIFSNGLLKIIHYTSKELDFNKRARTNFIRLQYDNNVCDIRLYTSNINLFDEKI
jgi:hypothetical protein